MLVEMLLELFFEPSTVNICSMLLLRGLDFIGKTYMIAFDVVLLFLKRSQDTRDLPGPCDRADRIRSCCRTEVIGCRAWRTANFHTGLLDHLFKRLSIVPYCNWHVFIRICVLIFRFLSPEIRCFVGKLRCIVFLNTARGACPFGKFDIHDLTLSILFCLR